MIIVRTKINDTKKIEEKMKEGYQVVSSSGYLKGKFSMSENYRGFIEYLLEKDPKRGENFIFRTYLRDKKDVIDLGNVKLVAKTEVPENQETYGYIEYIFEKISVKKEGEEREKELSYPITER